VAHMLRSAGLILGAISLFACKAGPSAFERAESTDRSRLGSADLGTLPTSFAEGEVEIEQGNADVEISAAARGQQRLVLSELEAGIGGWVDGPQEHNAIRPPARH